VRQSPRGIMGGAGRAGQRGLIAGVGLGPDAVGRGRPLRHDRQACLPGRRHLHARQHPPPRRNRRAARRRLRALVVDLAPPRTSPKPFGVDARADMLGEAARLAEERRIANVRWQQMPAEKLPADLPPMTVVSFAQSFH